jgi:hypothetical protein
MDQLASIGVAFQDQFIEKIFEQNCQYYENPPNTPITLSSIFSRKPWKQWATTSVYEKHRLIRPWGLGELYESETGIWLLGGKKTRTPGQYMRADPDTALPTHEPMVNTNERIHSSVRIRLDLDGLDLNDVGLYKCPALLKKGPWDLRQVRIKVYDPIGRNSNWGPASERNEARGDDLRWVWEYAGPDEDAPRVKMMIEENMGPYERQLLLLNKGKIPHLRRLLVPRARIERCGGGEILLP